MKILDIFAKAVSALAEIFDPQRLELDKYDNGIDVNHDVFDIMRNLGWNIQVTGHQVIQNVTGTRFGHHIGTTTLTIFSASKNGHEKGSELWYRDLCNVLEIPYEKSPVPITGKNLPRPPIPGDRSPGS